MTSRTLSTRVLVIDDEESVRDAFQATLMPKVLGSAALNSAASALFDEPAPAQASGGLTFDVDVAPNGPAGLAMVQEAVRQERPYCVVFCDMRMPGWDGIETVERLRQVDQRAEVVFVTAYSDYSLESIVDRAGANVGYFVKPFLSDEIRQLATKLVMDWNKARELEMLMRTVTSIRGDAGDMRHLISYMLSEICAWLDTDSAALFRLGESGALTFELGIGCLADQAQAVAKVAELPAVAPASSEIVKHRGTVLLPVERVGLAIALCGETRLTPDRKYLLQVFMEHAGLAIRNSDLQAKLIERERFAAVGEALSFVLHDVRGPVGTAYMLAGLLKPDSPLGRPAPDMVDRIQRQLSRAIGMLGDTLSLCRESIQLQLEEVELASAYADDLKGLQADLAARKSLLTIDIPAGLRAVIDRERLWRVIWNLASNGANAARRHEQPAVAIRARLVGDELAITVEDNGPGVPEAVLARLFQPFTTGESNGTGFGLAIVQRLVQAHGGEVSYRREGDLSVFSMSLPARGSDRPL